MMYGNEIAGHYQPTHDGSLIKSNLFGAFISIVLIFSASTMRARETSCRTSCFKNVLCNIQSTLDGLVACEISNCIGQADIPLVISIPGKYTICSDISFTADTAITVASSEVLIDMNGYTINGNNVGRIGIAVQPNLQNIEIRNGSLLSTSSTGIAVNTGVTSLVVDHITSNSHPYAGMEVQVGGSNVSVSNSQFNYNLGSGLVFRLR